MDKILKRVTAIPGFRKLWCRFPLGPVDLRVRHDAWERPEYAYGVYAAADLARRLHLPGITVVELGVAGGNGLLALEQVAAAVSKHQEIEISVFGFDRGEGMPEPRSYRDLPYVWDHGYYRMDRDALEAKLKSARLVIGDIGETLKTFRAPHPIGFVAFDLDYYSSTQAAFRIFDQDHLPRTYCYFDDIIWPEIACHNEYTGELCAIREFNEEHRDRKLCPLHGLRNMRLRSAGWNDHMYVFHDFNHTLYSMNINMPESSQLPLLV
jgi:hypothetical protein